MKTRLLRAACLLCAACLLLTGCVSRGGAPAVQATLPPVANQSFAPDTAESQEGEQTVLLYLPSLDGTHLLAVPRRARLSASWHSARTLCELLLAHPGTGSALPLGGGATLRLSDAEAVEVSGQVATVSLDESARELRFSQLFTVGQALADTLGQFGDIAYVNVLIDGSQPGLSGDDVLPAGCFLPNSREDLDTLWARASAPMTTGRRAMTAALYFPAQGGKGVLCEARSLIFSSQELPAMALTLLDALAAGAESLPAVPPCEAVRTLLIGDPTLEGTEGQRRLVFRYPEGFNRALLDAGITRSVMMASLTFTMTTFLPGIDGIEVRIGGERINTLTPSGIYGADGEQITITFPDGLMRRGDFLNFLLSYCTLYFADGNGKLCRVYRAIPYGQAHSARTLTEELISGPQPFDSQSGLSAVLPEGLRADDLLDVALKKNTVMLNFSSRLPALCEGMTAEEEKRLVYAVVNTLCEMEEVSKVAFFVQGSQPASLAGAVFLPGDFMPNADLVE